MQEQTKIAETIDGVKDYLSTRYELAVLKGSDKLAHIASNVISVIPIVFVTVLAVVMLSFALAMYLNSIYLNQYFGFLVVGGAYFVIAILLLSVRKNAIAKPFRNKIIKELFRNHHNGL